MNLPEIERRRYERYDTETKISFVVNYDLNTKVSFRLVKEKSEKAKEYEGITRNISAEGLRFGSRKKLQELDKLYLELYLPRQKWPIRMTAEVRWSRKLPLKGLKGSTYETGVKLLTIGRIAVSDTIYFDKKYGVYWSGVLESVFGNFKKLIPKIKK